jgi:membrane protein DedA with SNARE-associated domain
MESILAWISNYGYAALFALLMFGIAGLPIPDETILMFCGYLIATGRLEPVTTFVVGVCGTVCGISLSYVIGRTVGHTALYRYGKYIRITPGHIERAHRWFRRMGEWLLTFGYFIPAVRHFTALVAGMSELEYRVFAFFAYLGAVIWVATFLSIGYFLGENWRIAIELVHEYTLWLVGIAAVGIAMVWWYRARSRK